MDSNDPRRPLLGGVREDRMVRAARKLCGLESWRRRLPITIWLPRYSVECLLRDLIAGITVGLTAIPQGIAYAMVAGLPPQVGLYSSIFPGLVYTLFGSCKDVTVGPTAILSALLAKYVARSADFAYLAAFLSGCVILLLGVLQLGFLLDFISKPVISGFTTAAALQISASQLKGLFRIAGKSGDTFIDAVVNFVRNIKSVQPWDTVLGVGTIVALVLLKKSSIRTSAASGACAVNAAGAWRYGVRARNALVVLAAALLAYCLQYRGEVPFALTGKIEGGLPRFGPPPFSTVVNNRTLGFDQMLEVFGAEGLVMPLVAVLESIAIAKAFAGSKPVDATQEMIALGACNILGSFAQAAPATGSFTRTALNHASGVMTPAGSFFKAILVLLSVTLLSDAFYFIPRATLAGIIVVAMVSLVDYAIVAQLWATSKSELAVWALTAGVGAGAGLEYGIAAGAAADALRALAAAARPPLHTQLFKSELAVWALTAGVGAGAGLEYGIAAGAAADALRALAAAARPPLHTQLFKVGHQDCLSVTLLGTLSYASAEHVPREVRKHARARSLVFVIDGRHLDSIDVGVAENLIAALLELAQQRHRFLLWNFAPAHRRTIEVLRPGIEDRFVSGPSIDQHVLGLEVLRSDNTLNTIT